MLSKQFSKDGTEKKL